MSLAATTSPQQTVREWQHAIAKQLAETGSETALLDARLLLQHTLGWDMTHMVAQSDYALNTKEEQALQALAARRAACEPMAYILGSRDFWKSSFAVSPATLIPRPDSETLIEAVLAARADTDATYRILDLGTGTGCLALSLLQEYPNATATAADQSADALAMAQQNADALGLAARCEMRQSNWCDTIDGSYDIIISNPPYITSADCENLAKDVREFEPRSALDGGADGLDDYRSILQQAKQHLATDGLLACEIGAGQAEEIRAIATQENYQFIGARCDLAGIERVLLFTL